jgi:hypothetical protein
MFTRNVPPSSLSTPSLGLDLSKLRRESSPPVERSSHDSFLADISPSFSISIAPVQTFMIPTSHTAFQLFIKHLTISLLVLIHSLLSKCFIDIDTTPHVDGRMAMTVSIPNFTASCFSPYARYPTARQQPKPKYLTCIRAGLLN